MVARVHIRYEDGTALPGTTISAGLCLQSLVAETTNSKWKETQINGKAKTIFKLLRFTKFSLYWNADDRHSVGEQGATNWRLAMRDILESACQGTNMDSVLLLPLCGRMKIMMNR